LSENYRFIKSIQLISKIKNFEMIFDELLFVAIKRFSQNVEMSANIETEAKENDVNTDLYKKQTLIITENRVKYFFFYLQQLKQSCEAQATE
jgi:hypothetical protein